jgi:hypothetical protein
VVICGAARHSTGAAVGVWSLCVVLMVWSSVVAVRASSPVA